MREHTIADAFPPRQHRIDTNLTHLAIMVPLIAYAILSSMMSELRLWLLMMPVNCLGSFLLWVKVVRTLLDRLAAGDSALVAVKEANLKRSISRVGLSVLELPEILFLIAPHLELHGGRSICSALRVCKTWYGSFIHLIWRDLELHGSQTPYRYLLAKRGLVKSLVLWGDVPSRYVQLEYPHLTRLEVNTKFGSVITDLIDRHRKSLRQIRLKENPHVSDSHSFWRTLASLPRLQRLDMTDMLIKDNSKALDVAFSAPLVELRLQTLSIHGHRPVHLEETWKPYLLRLQKIAISNVRVKRVFADELASRFAFCPNLQSLEWDVTVTDAAQGYCPLVPVENDPENDSFGVRAPSWPSLTILRLTVRNLADDQVAAILLSLQRGLTKLELQETRFGQQATMR